MYKYIVLSVLIIGISCAPPSRKRERNASQRKCAQQSVYEDCVQSLLSIGIPEKHFPNTTEQMTGLCGKLKDVSTCVKDYAHKCMSPSQRRATAVAIAGIARSAKRMCKSPPIQQEFIKHSKCGNAMLGDIRSCFNVYKMSLYGAKQVKVSDKLAIMCCKYNDFRGCMGKAFLRVGPEVCPEESQMFYAKVAEASQSDVTALYCSPFSEDPNKCKGIVVPEVKPSSNTRSAFAPLRDVLESVLENSSR